MSNLTVYQLPGGWGLESISPFCLKLDAILRLNGIPFTPVVVATPFAGPKKKAPWIELDGKAIGDSSLIIEALRSANEFESEAGLDAKQHALTVLVERLIDENLYWALVYDRWCRPENWPILKQSVLGGMPVVIREIIAPLARRSVKAQLKGHGMGLHKEDEIVAIARRDIQALSALLDQNMFFHGDNPSLIDATVFSLLANIYFVAFSSPMKSIIREHPNLVAFMERFQQAVYPKASLDAL